MEIFVLREKYRQSVSSLAPFLRESLLQGCVMDPTVMAEEDRKHCRWLEFGIGKGVTGVRSRVSVYGVPGRMKRGLHGELMQGFPNVDPVPRCYDEDHALGFSDFVRWVYFADPADVRGVLGVDWSLSARPTAGIAHTMLRVCAVAEICLVHGIPADDELVLLNCRMVEDSFAFDVRRMLGLRSVRDWAERGFDVFGEGSPHCPRCGLATLAIDSAFCFRCGCKPQLIKKED